MSAELELMLLAALLFGAVAMPLLALAARLARTRLRAIEPSARAGLYCALAAGPFALAILGVGACLLPSMEHDHDHCLHHAGHPHLCLHHPPAHASLVGWWVLALAGAWIAARAAMTLRGLLRDRARAASLVRLAQDDSRVRTIESDRPFSAAIGLWRPVVVISRGLDAHLEPDELEAVLAHEHAHARRRDALRLAFARLAWSALPRAWSASLLAELALATEQACDAHAAEAVGDPLIVADALVRCARALSPSSLQTALSFGPSATAERVHALLEPPARRAPSAWWLVLVIALAVFGAEPLHHATETILGILFR